MMVKHSQDAVLAHMRMLVGRYSMESVAMDGERSVREQAVVVREGKREWERAVRLLGREPTNIEMYPNYPKGRGQHSICRPEGLYAE